MYRIYRFLKEHPDFLAVELALTPAIQSALGGSRVRDVIPLLVGTKVQGIGSARLRRVEKTLLAALPDIALPPHPVTFSRSFGWLDLPWDLECRLGRLGLRTITDLKEMPRTVGVAYFGDAYDLIAQAVSDGPVNWSLDVLLSRVTNLLEPPARKIVFERVWGLSGAQYTYAEIADEINRHKSRIGQHVEAIRLQWSSLDFQLALAPLADWLADPLQSESLVPVKELAARYQSMSRSRLDCEALIKWVAEAALDRVLARRFQISKVCQTLVVSTGEELSHWRVNRLIDKIREFLSTYLVPLTVDDIKQLLDKSENGTVSAAEVDAALVVASWGPLCERDNGIGLRKWKGRYLIDVAQWVRINGPRHYQEIAKELDLNARRLVRLVQMYPDAFDCQDGIVSLRLVAVLGQA